MKRLVYSLTILTAIIAMSCKTADKKISNSEPMQKSQKATPFAVVVDTTFNSENIFNIDGISSLSISGDILTLTVTYTGCVDDRLDLVFNGMYMKSLPPKVQLFFKRKGGSEKCNETQVREMKFDVSPVRYTGSTRTVIIKIPKYQEQISYQY